MNFNFFNRFQPKNFVSTTNLESWVKNGDLILRGPVCASLRLLEALYGGRGPSRPSADAFWRFIASTCDLCSSA